MLCMSWFGSITAKLRVSLFNRVTPMTVSDYYKALLMPAWEALHHSVPANRARLDWYSAAKTFEDAFWGTYFHFSHYGKANDCFPMCDTYSWANWLCGTAIVCHLNQELTDHMAPIYFSTLGNMSPKTISVNLDQDKTGQSVNPANVAIQSAEDLSIFLHGNKLPYQPRHYCHNTPSLWPPKPGYWYGGTSLWNHLSRPFRIWNHHGCNQK